MFKGTEPTKYIALAYMTGILPIKKYKCSFEEVKRWYDGYKLLDYQIYNPRAVVNLMRWGEFQSYWSQTGTYEAVLPLINMDFDGLKTAVIEMLSGAAVEVEVDTFQNDTVSFADKDDVLTYLIHLGYLGYDQKKKKAFIPNEEIRQEFQKALKRKKWNQSAETALKQIKDKQYPESIKEYTGSILLVGISYDKKTKIHECKIERYEKG